MKNEGGETPAPRVGEREEESELLYDRNFSGWSDVTTESPSTWLLFF